ncbi:hypothetical protein E3N88_45578 [Mikania micrantha]|uniref:Dof-type domain-containing protein n=1 Tax=Mikania micrantha TaxID=192012 RepID=A0A5N6L8R6_9ASTR|nr:hypothetical protein E3N88_45578 [Mikania micrantha]
MDHEDDPEEDPVEDSDEDPEEVPGEDDPEEDPQEDPEEDPLEEPHGDPQKAPAEDSTEESSYRMPPRFRACKRPRFESDDVARLTWESKSCEKALGQNCEVGKKEKCRNLDQSQDFGFIWPRPLFSKRYWTKGGALRNIPIGGGCRKNKKTKSCSSKFIIGSSSSSSDGVSAPVMDFQLGGMNYPHRVNQFSSNYGENTLPFMNLDPLGFNHNQTGSNVSANFQEEMGFPDTNLHHNLQSLSSLNQDLHWKLQQQRLAMLIGGVNNGYASGHDQDNHHRQHTTKRIWVATHFVSES